MIPGNSDLGMKDIGRLAMQVEGDTWLAYYAPPGDRRGALFLGSIRLRFVQDSKERKRIFLNLMQEAAADIIEEKTGERPRWPAAPESEA
jgi:hypothetical protein